MHREVGPGFLEAVYHRAMGIALAARGLQFLNEQQVHVMYAATASVFSGSIS